MDWSLRRLVGSWVCVAGGDEREDACVLLFTALPYYSAWIHYRCLATLAKASSNVVYVILEFVPA